MDRFQLKLSGFVIWANLGSVLDRSTDIKRWTHSDHWLVVFGVALLLIRLYVR